MIRCPKCNKPHINKKKDYPDGRIVIRMWECSCKKILFSEEIVGIAAEKRLKELPEHIPTPEELEKLDD